MIHRRWYVSPYALITTTSGFSISNKLKSDSALRASLSHRVVYVGPRAGFVISISDSRTRTQTSLKDFGNLFEIKIARPAC